MLDHHCIIQVYNSKICGLVVDFNLVQVVEY